MTSTESKYDPLTGKVSSVFWRYAIPEIIGLFAISSAGFVDALFLGNFVGPEALATVNLSIPALTTFFAFALLIAVGGSVVCGKFIGQKNRVGADQVFTSTMLFGLVVTAIFMILEISYLDQIVFALGATDPILKELLNQYLGIILWFTPFFIFEVILFYFVRLDGQPELASAAFVIGSLVNMLLDYLFIAHFGWGIEGAATATGISAAVSFIILIPYFFTKYSKLSFSKPLLNFKILLRSYLNGLSEFVNEASVGITTLIFNWVIITRMGMDGVAALTIIDNVWFMGLYICIGMCDSLQPSISQNFGAQNHKRIMEFLTVASVSVLFVGFAMIGTVLFFPDFLIGLFLEKDELETRQIASVFMGYIWPAFIFVGLNILLSVYFTSMHKPFESGLIALLRSLILPAICLLTLPNWFGDVGMFVTLPIAEAITFVVAFTLFIKKQPLVIIQADAKQP